MCAVVLGARFRVRDAGRAGAGGAARRCGQRGVVVAGDGRGAAGHGAVARSGRAGVVGCAGRGAAPGGDADAVGAAGARRAQRQYHRRR
eukprot:ctg_1144.g439